MACGEETDVACDGLLLADPAFAGSDGLATARALAAALVDAGGFDLVLTGRRGVDAHAGQVGAQVAELLGLPFAADARYLSLQRSTLHVRGQHDDGWGQVEVELPAVVSCAERLIDPCPSGRDARLASARPLRLVTAAGLGPGPWGAAARRTRTRTHPMPGPRATRERIVVEGDPDEQARAAVSVLARRARCPSRATRASRCRRPSTAAPRSRWSPSPAAPTSPGSCSGRPPGWPRRSTVTRSCSTRHPDPVTLGTWGADVVVHLDGPVVEEDVAGALAGWAHAVTPWAILAPDTDWGREVRGPRRGPPRRRAPRVRGRARRSTSGTGCSPAPRSSAGSGS